MKALFDWKSITILIVEDDDSSFIYVSESLKPYGPEIIRCKSGLVAFFRCMKYPRPDLVIMDIKLPEMGGYDATRLIKKYQSKIPVIAFTACAMQEEKQQCLSSGCDAYLAKPVLPHDLLDTVNIYLSQSIGRPKSSEFSIR